jgi:hypothetical protein
MAVTTGCFQVWRPRPPSIRTALRSWLGPRSACEGAVVCPVRVFPGGGVASDQQVFTRRGVYAEMLAAGTRYPESTVFNLNGAGGRSAMS